MVTVCAVYRPLGDTTDAGLGYRPSGDTPAIRRYAFGIRGVFCVFMQSCFITLKVY